MSNLKSHQILVIALSFVAAWILMIMPISEGLRWFRPEFLSLVVIFWVFAFPNAIGVLVAWCAGLMMDILVGGILGQYALSLVVVAYLARLLHNRMRAYPFWQQMMVILSLVAIGQLFLALSHWMLGNPPRTLLYWLPSLTSVALWPWMHRLLRQYERKKIR